ncbi:MAG: hypothetical protein N4A71_14210 [Carboxylicivirga sp.]|jgi:hypothetical protein|nr:hypothetical protein [Carboxylicivirga sp.]MCT4644788.1 hypothetical protein [Carboxylicivirga sp.]
MKKLIFILFLGFGLISANAQEVGLRFGGSNGLGGVAVDGVFSMGQFSRVHADVAIWDGYLGVDALWDFIYRPLGEEAFNWYVGFGPSTLIGDEFWLGASGELGIEYKFKEVPLALGADWRPTFWLVEDTTFGVDSFGLNIRWVFGDSGK